jgi:hypothetical protein
MSVPCIDGLRVIAPVVVVFPPRAVADMLGRSVIAPVVVVLGCVLIVATAAAHGWAVAVVPLNVAVPVDDVIWYSESSVDIPTPEAVHGAPGLVMVFPSITAPTQNSLAVAVVPVVPDDQVVDVPLLPPTLNTSRTAVPRPDTS